MADLIFWLSLAVGLFVPLYIYVRTNDAKIGPLHPAALAHSPERWAPESVRRTAAEIQTKLKGSTSGSLIAPEEMPPKTGRRYIITGGVSVRFVFGVWYFAYGLRVRSPSRERHSLQRDSRRTASFAGAPTHSCRACQALRACSSATCHVRILYARNWKCSRMPMAMSTVA